MSDPRTTLERARQEYGLACSGAQAELSDLLAGADGGVGHLLDLVERARRALEAMRTAERVASFAGGQS